MIYPKAILPVKRHDSVSAVYNGDAISLYPGWRDEFLTHHWVKTKGFKSLNIINRYKCICGARLNENVFSGESRSWKWILPTESLKCDMSEEDHICHEIIT